MSTDTNSLQSVNPDIARDWNYERNGDLCPSDVAAKSNRKVWWKCKVGHEWQTSVSNRTRGGGCPFCSGRRVLAGFNDLSTVNPKLADEWDYDKNSGMLPSEVTAGSDKIVWWKCEKGHEWQTHVYTRNSGVGCPYCSGKKAVAGENDLATLNPGLSLEWNYDRNGGLLPSEVTAKSAMKVWWKCQRDHEWQASIEHRARGHGCIYCSGQRVLAGFNDLATVNPEVAKEWNYDRNDGLLPSEITAGSSHKKVWWKCTEGHEWQSVVATRNEGRGCPYCSSNKVLPGYNDLATVNPDVAKEWNYDKNNGLLPSEVTANSSSRKVWWKCSVCGNEWQARIDHRNSGSGCTKCGFVYHTSTPEQIILHYVKKSYPDAISGYKASWLGTHGLELDIFIPEISVGIEYDGAHWHSDVTRDKRKNQLCEDNGIRLIRIREEGCPNIETPYQISVPKTKTDMKYMEEAISQLYSMLSSFDPKVEIPSVTIEDDIHNIYSQFLSSKESKSLEYNRPEIAAEWNYDRNGGLLPSEITTNANKKVWWKCKNGHEWKTLVTNRIRGNGCPYCSGKMVLAGYNDLATVNPTLAKEWNYEKNGELLPSEITAGTSRKVWWKCMSGHEWKAVVSSRNQGVGCPVCSGHKVLTGYNDLITINPDLAREWNYERNEGLLPSEITSNNGRKVWWKCSNGHEWQAQIASRNKGCGCPYCAGQRVLEGYNDLATVNSSLAKEWNYERNYDVTPHEVTAGTDRKVWWKCKKGHEWQASICSRTHGNGCPYCAGKLILVGKNDLETVNSVLSLEWNYDKNKGLLPSQVTAFSSKKVWWKCRLGHEWQSSVSNRSHGNGCPYCAGKRAIRGKTDLATINPQLALEWNSEKNNGISPEDVTVCSSKKVWWKCPNCGNEWQETVYNRNKKTKCPRCSHKLREDLLID